MIKVQMTNKQYCYINPLYIQDIMPCLPTETGYEKYCVIRFNSGIEIHTEGRLSEIHDFIFGGNET